MKKTIIFLFSAAILLFAACLAGVLVHARKDKKKPDALELFLKEEGNEGRISVVEGTILERSVLLDPKKSDYPNCRFTAHFRGNAIQSGEACPKEIALIIEGFENYKLLESNSIQSGDKVLCTIIPFEQLPPEAQSTQQADDLQLYLLDSYYVAKIETIEDFSDNELMPASGIFFSDGGEDYVSFFERQINPPVPDAIREAQNAAIRDDLTKMNAMLKVFDDETIRETNARFAQAWKKEKAKDAPGYNRLHNYVWRNVRNSFWTLPVDYTLLKKPVELSQETLNCFSSLKKALEANGVQLVVALVPDLYVISARVMNHEFRDIPDIETALYVKQLSETGIETVYVSDQIIQNYNRFPFAFFYPSNGHPSDTAQDVISDMLAERLRRYDIPQELDPALFSERQQPHTYGDDLEFCFPQKCDIGNNRRGRTYTCRQILYDGQTIPRTKESPVLIIGNSFIEKPVSPPESLPSLVSFKLRSFVDWYRIAGYGPFSDILIQFLANPDFYLKGKKVLVMQVGTEHIRTVNDSGLMLNMAQLDEERMLLNKKTMKQHLFLTSNTDAALNADQVIWGPLANTSKAVFKIDGSGVWSCNLSIGQNDDAAPFDESKPVICIMPSTCVRNTSCKLTVNGQEKQMRSFNHAENARFFNLTFEFPAGTKEINIKAEGKPDTVFAVKDIQIWQ